MDAASILRALPVIVALLIGVSLFFTLRSTCKSVTKALKVVSFGKAKVSCDKSVTTNVVSGVCALSVAACVLGLIRTFLPAA